MAGTLGCRGLFLVALTTTPEGSLASSGQSVASSVPVIGFSAQGGGHFPALAFGTSDMKDPEVVNATVFAALREGFRHLDTAELYENLQAVGTALNSSGLRRSEVFLTVKVSFWDKGDELARLRRSLAELGVEWADLCLLHSPFVGSRLELAAAYLPHRLGRFKPVAWRPLRWFSPPVRWLLQALARRASQPSAAISARQAAWHRLEDARAAGLCRHIGVSNYDAALLEELRASARELPAADQIEFHPRFQAQGTVEACRRLGIAVMGYGSGLSMGSQPVRRIAEARTASPAQVALRWVLQMGAAGVVRSSRRAGMAENLAAARLPPLQEEEMEALRGMDEGRAFYWDPSALASGPSGGERSEL